MPSHPINALGFAVLLWAVGFAWGSALKGEDRVALTFFGDGATSEGSFHEGATFAVRCPLRVSLAYSVAASPKQLLPGRGRTTEQVVTHR